MRPNAAGLIVSGDKNPNWKGGLIDKKCVQCGADYRVKNAHSSSRFCSLQCVGLSQRGKSSRKSPPKIVTKQCAVCGIEFPVHKSHEKRVHCCSRVCSNKRRSKNNMGPNNPNWSGGLSRLPYPWDFNKTSKLIISRDGGVCQNPSCSGVDKRMTAHHINYKKMDCRPQNLITLCSSCNSKANFGRDDWQAIYEELMRSKKHGGGWEVEAF